jgi:hypothetical protein
VGGQGWLWWCWRTSSATGRRSGCKLSLPLLLAARDGCPLLQSDAGAATIRHRQCYNRLPALLQYTAGDATIFRRCCYQRMPALLQYAAGDATIGLQHCYNLPPALLRNAAGAATIRRRQRCKRCPALLLSAPRHLLRLLLRVLQVAPDLATSSTMICSQRRRQLLLASPTVAACRLLRCPLDGGLAGLDGILIGVGRGSGQS